MRRCISAFLLSSMLPGCAEDPAQVGDFGDVVVQTLGAEGGTIAVPHAAGFTLTLDIPEGALFEEVTFTVEPLAPDGGLARFLLSPSGIVPALPATLTVASDQDLPSAASLGFDERDGVVPLPTRRSTRSATATLPILGLRSGSGGRTARTAGDAEESTVVSLAELSCEARVLELERRLDKSVALGGAPDDIARERLAIEAVRGDCSSEEIARIEAAACGRYDVATSSLAALAVDDEATFVQVVGGLLQAKTAVELAGVDTCDDEGFLPLILSKVEQFVALQGVTYARTPFSTDVEAHLDRIDDLYRYEIACFSTGQPDGACLVVTRTLLPDVLDRLRRAAWEDCRTRQDPFSVGVLLAHPLAPAVENPGGAPYFDHGRYTFAELEADADHCGAEVALKAFEDAAFAPTELVDRRATLQADDDVGSRVVPLGLSLPVGGSLALGGTLPAPRCVGGGGRGEDGVLVARVGGVELDRVTRSGDRWVLGPGALEILVDEALVAAGQPATGGSFRVVVSREEGTCPAYTWPSTLFEIGVTVGMPRVLARLDMPTPTPHVPVFRHTHVTGLDCDEETVDQETHDAPPLPAGARELPHTFSAFGSSLTVAQASPDRISGRITASLGPGFTDVCTDGFVDTAASSVMFDLDLVLEVHEDAQVTFHWTQPTMSSSGWLETAAGGQTDGASRSGLIEPGPPEAPLVVRSGREIRLEMFGVVRDMAGVSLVDEEVFSISIAAPPTSP